MSGTLMLLMVGALAAAVLVAAILWLGKKIDPPGKQLFHDASLTDSMKFTPQRKKDKDNQ
jgi:hypothetical protein